MDLFCFDDDDTKRLHLTLVSPCTLFVRLTEHPIVANHGPRRLLPSLDPHLSSLFFAAVSIANARTMHVYPPALFPLP